MSQHGEPRQSNNIINRYATLREELLHEQNWMTPKLSRAQMFIAGGIVGWIIGIATGILTVFAVYRVLLWWNGGI